MWNFLKNNDNDDDTDYEARCRELYRGKYFLQHPFEIMNNMYRPPAFQYITVVFLLTFLYFFVVSFVHIGGCLLVSWAVEPGDEFWGELAIILCGAFASFFAILAVGFNESLAPKQYNWFPGLIAVFFWAMVIVVCWPIALDYSHTAWPTLASKYFLLSSPTMAIAEAVANIAAVIFAFVIAENYRIIRIPKKPIVIMILMALMAVIYTGFQDFETAVKGVPAPAKQETSQKSATTEKLVETKPAKPAETKKAPAKNANQEKLDKASAVVQAMGISGKVEASSYESNDKGFIAIVDRKLIIVDVKNNQYAKIDNANCLKDFADLVKQQRTGPIIVRLAIPNDKHDQDEKAGFWDGNTHHIPFYILWTYENNQPVDNGLFTGNGQNPYRYETYFYESKNVTLAHIFLSDALLLLKDANQRGLSK